jgi:hypothetical protein
LHGRGNTFRPSGSLTQEVAPHLFSGDAIIWSDGTRSSLASPHPSVIVGNRSSVVVGQGVFVGKGTGSVPTENPSDPRRARCPVLDGVAYCY